MCLAVPGKVVELRQSGAGVVDYMGNRVEANFSLLPGIKAGDWVIVHAGFAISVLDRKEAKRTLAMFRDIDRLERAD